MADQSTNGHQLRTEATKARLLAAAEEVFVREGFENAQLHAIAKAAGRTKGSIYAHYRGKDDLFLALYEHRTREQIDHLLGLLENCSTREEAVCRFKDFLISTTQNKSWPLLTLEFKLYSVRHPESRERWVKSHDLVRATERDVLNQKLFGKLSAPQRKRLERSILAVGPILSALTLETYFEPQLLSSDNFRHLFSSLVDTLLRPEE